MLDRRRTRQLLLFLGNVVSGVVTPVVSFAVVASGDDNGPPAAALLFVVAPVFCAPASPGLFLFKGVVVAFFLPTPSLGFVRVVSFALTVHLYFSQDRREADPSPRQKRGDSG
jgi:hypothetical protein